MCARLHPRPADDRLRGVGGGAHDVRVGDGVGQRLGGPNGKSCGGELLHERAETVGVACCHGDGLEPVPRRERPGMGACLHPGADDRHPLGVASSEVSGRQHGPGCRARGGDERAVHHGQRRPVGRIEADDHGLVGRLVDVVGEQRHQLRGEGTGSGEVRRHRDQQPVTLIHASGDAGWHRDPAAGDLGHGTGERLDQLVEVEDLLHLVVGQDEHLVSVTQPVADRAGHEPLVTSARCHRLLRFAAFRGQYAT